jgi:hypothetical protein
MASRCHLCYAILFKETCLDCSKLDLFDIADEGKIQKVESKLRNLQRILARKIHAPEQRELIAG